MKIVKKLVIGVAALALLLVIGVVVALMFINSIAKAGIEKGGTYALGVPTTVKSVDISLLGGTFAMSGFNVANPPGKYKTTDFMGLGQTKVAVSLASLNKETVELPELTLENLTLNLEKTADGANYRVIMDNLAKLQGAGGGTKTEPAAGDSGKKFVINKLRVRNVKISAQLIGAPGAVGQVLNDATSANVTLDEISLDNVGKTGSGVAGSGVTMGQLISIITQAVLSAAVDKGGGLLPGDLVGDLKGGLGQLKPLSDLGINVASGAAKAVGEVGKEVANKVGEVGKGVADKAGEIGKGAAEKIGEGFKGLLPGQKKDEPK